MLTSLTTERLTLRRAEPADLDGIHALASDFEVVKNTASWPWPPDRDFTATRAMPMDPAWGMSGPVFQGDEIIGMMGVHDNGALGYMFARAHWGKGIATEMANALIKHGFATYDWAAVNACVFDDNPASTRVLEKLGFTEGAGCSSDCRARNGTFATRTFTLPRP